MHAPSPFILPPDMLLLAYRSGVFPMADGREDEDLFWVEPRERAIIPLDGFRLSRSLAKTLRQDRFEVTCNRDFAAVIEQCAQPRPGHPETWISRRIEQSYIALHQAGHAHSIECWRDGELVGGLYGVSFDRVFCGESMFSRTDNASKVALAWLVALMRRSGYRLLDCQFMTEHLASLGAETVTRDQYLVRLAQAGSDGEAPDLPGAYHEVMDQALASQFASSEAPSSAASSSSPGKLIAQSLTQTS